MLLLYYYHYSISESSGLTLVHNDSNVFHRYRFTVHADHWQRRHDDCRFGNDGQNDNKHRVRL